MLHTQYPHAAKHCGHGVYLTHELINVIAFTIHIVGECANIWCFWQLTIGWVAEQDAVVFTYYKFNCVEQRRIIQFFTVKVATQEILTLVGVIGAGANLKLCVMLADDSTIITSGVGLDGFRRCLHIHLVGTQVSATLVFSATPVCSLLMAKITIVQVIQVVLATNEINIKHGYTSEVLPPYLSSTV